MNRLKPFASVPSILFSIFAVVGFSFPSMQFAGNCAYWVAPPPLGSDVNPGTQARPWASLEHAGETVPDSGCTVWIQDGIYNGENQIKRRFTSFTFFKAVHPYKPVFQNLGPALTIKGGKQIVVQGLVFQHSGPGASPLVVQVERSSSVWAENIVLRDNIFRNSYNNDLLKVYDGARFVSVQNNLFYNQGEGEQHMDVNSVSDVRIQDNVFFNDFAGSGRPVLNDTKHYIVIKDSNGSDDGLLGSLRITVQRNIFLNWQGDPGETFLQVGNDGKPYNEARQVLVQNNLFLGNSPYPMKDPFGVSGAAGVTFRNNTVSGNLPGDAYSTRIVIKGSNPKNHNIRFCNNIWSDPTGTMGNFSDGDFASTTDLTLNHNLYWNGGKVIPAGDLLSPMVHDRERLVANPRLESRLTGLLLPTWNGAKFPSGNRRIRAEFLRLAKAYASLPDSSPAIWKADPACSPQNDLLGKPRGTAPSYGAYQGPTK
jgi:hypothetical protein